MENWTDFLNKQIKCIIEDTDYPKKKEGLCTEINNTHLVIKKYDNSKEALLLSKIIRIEVK